MDALVGCLDEQDGFLRYKAIAAIELHRREHPGLRFPSEVIENLVVRETAQYYNYLTLRHNLSRHDAGRGSLLDHALDDKLARTLDRIFRLVGLLYSMDDVAAARYAIEHGDRAPPGRGRGVPRQSAQGQRPEASAADSR